MAFLTDGQGVCSGKHGGKPLLSFSVGSQGLSGNRIAFIARFRDHSEAIYIATLNPTSVPESSATLGVLAIGGLGTLSVLQRKYKKVSNPSRNI